MNWSDLKHNEQERQNMNTRQMNGVSLTLTTLAAVALLAGCGTTSGYKQADKTGEGIAEFRVEITNGKKAIDNTMKALDSIALSATTDPRKAFEQYAKAVSNLESVAEKAKKRGTDMQTSGKAYFDQWEKQMSEVQNPEIRKLAQERKTKLQEAFASIKKYSEPLKTQFGPWMSHLKDLQTFLSNDLTIAGVDAAKGLFAKAKTEGQDVQKSMDGLIAELNTVSAALTPAKAQK
jgi:hypothetical protein